MGAAPGGWFSGEAEGKKLNRCLGLEGMSGEGRTNGLQAGLMGRIMGYWEVSLRLVYCVQPGLQTSFIPTWTHTYTLSVQVWCSGLGAERTGDLSRAEPSLLYLSESCGTCRAEGIPGN